MTISFWKRIRFMEERRSLDECMFWLGTMTRTGRIFAVGGIQTDFGIEFGDLSPGTAGSF